MRHKETWPALCTATLFSCSDRDCTRFFNIIGFENIRIHPSTCYRIRCGFIIIFFSHSGGRIKNIRIRCRIRRIRVDSEKPFPERKSCGFNNIRTLVEGALVYGPPRSSSERLTGLAEKMIYKQQ